MKHIRRDSVNHFRGKETVFDFPVSALESLVKYGRGGVRRASMVY